MRIIIIGGVTGACVCVLAVAVLGAISGYVSPDGYPPGLLPGLPRTVVGCLWALAYFGLIAGSAGGLLGTLIGAAAAGIRLALRGPDRPGVANQQGRGERRR